jgi:hypothetical protein
MCNLTYHLGEYYKKQYDADLRTMALSTGRRSSTGRLFTVSGIDGNNIWQDNGKEKRGNVSSRMYHSPSIPSAPPSVLVYAPEYSCNSLSSITNQKEGYEPPTAPTHLRETKGASNAGVSKEREVLRQFISSINLPYHVFQILDGNDITLETIGHMTNDDYKELGIAIGHKVAIMNGLKRGSRMCNNQQQYCLNPESPVHAAA